MYLILLLNKTKGKNYLGSNDKVLCFFFPREPSQDKKGSERPLCKKRDCESGRVRQRGCEQSRAVAVCKKGALNNAVHGYDSVENAAIEIAHYFG